MHIELITKFYKKLRSDNLSIIYQGDFSDGLTEKIIALSEYSIGKSPEIIEMRNKVSFVIVECFQNIVRHGNDHGVNSDNSVWFPGLFSARNCNEFTYIASGNLIEKKDVSFLKDKLEQLNKLDKAQIKELYLDLLTSGTLSKKGGAGLGLVEMARKSLNPVEFDFEDENEKVSVFYLMLKLQANRPRGINNKEHKIEKSVAMVDVKDIHEIMRKENILMIYKGDFSQETIIPMLKMIEENLNKQQEGLHLKKKLNLVLIEVLQNISKHSVAKNGKKDAIFMIGKTEQKYIICTGNIVDAKSSEKITKKINKVNGLNKDELIVYYKKSLKEALADEYSAGLGIIDIARESSEKLIFDLKPEGEGLSFFSLCVHI